LTVKPMGLVNGLKLKCDRKEGVKSDSKAL
jgi:hypothetical protein